MLKYIFVPLTSSFRGSRQKTQKWKMMIVAWAESIEIELYENQIAYSVPT